VDVWAGSFDAVSLARGIARTHPELSSRVVVALSAESSSAHRESELFAAKVGAVIAKPWGLEALTAVTRQVLADDGEAPSPAGTVKATRAAPAARPLATATYAGDRIMTLTPGQAIDGRFEVLTLLGCGSHACVYRVRDRSLGLTVALKIVKRATNDQHVEPRFRQEMRMLRKLSHPHIVRTFDFGVFEGRPYCTMELLEGQSVRELLDDRLDEPLPVMLTLDIGEAVADALVAVHEAAVVHRDLKPSNVLVTEDGAVKLMDFGIASSLEDPLGLTTPDLVMGTPAYLSPERLLSSAPARPAADLYALGVLLFECLTGRRPFTGGPLDQLLRRICDEPPPPIRTLNPEAPAGLAELVAELMAKRPEDRPGSASLVLRRLRGLIATGR